MVSPATKTPFTAGILMYDVPKGKEAYYNRIRAAIGDVCVMQTWSCYIFNWAFKDKLEKAMEGLNADADQKSRVQYRLLLLDPSQAEEHEQMVLEALQRLLRNTVNLMTNRLIKAKAKIEKASKEGTVPDETMGKARRYSCAQAKKSIEKAQKLAIVFEQDKALDDAFAAYQQIVDAEHALDEQMDVVPHATPKFAAIGGRVIDF